MSDSSSSSSSDSSSSSSSSVSSSSSSGSSVSSSNSRKGNKKSQKVTVSRAKASNLSKWIVTGIKSSKVKDARESFKVKLKGKSDLLINPVLDEAFYQRLKQRKGSNACKANIEPLEKIYRNQCYKGIDLAKPLLFLSSRSKLKKKTKADDKAIRVALKLWATLYRDIMQARRKNILSQVYPDNISLLDDHRALPAGGDHLFGPKFISALVGSDHKCFERPVTES